LVRIASAAIEALAGRSLRQLLVKWGVVKNEAVECIKDVVEEVASKWGWDVDTFRRFVKTVAGKTITEDEVKKMIEEALEKIKEELNKVKASNGSIAYINKSSIVSVVPTSN